MTSAPIPIARKNDSTSTDESDSDPDSDSSCSDFDSDIDRMSRRGSQWSAIGIPLDGGKTAAGTMAYSLIDAQSLQRHQEMISRAAGRHRGSRDEFSKAQSLPLPRAPFLSSTRQDLESRLTGLPPISLPESAVLDDIDGTTGQSVPSTFGSLRNSTFNGDIYSRKNQQRSKAAQSSSLGVVSTADAYSLLGRSRPRVRQRLDEEEQKQNTTHGQKTELQYDEHLGDAYINRMECLDHIDSINSDIHHEPPARESNHPSLLGTSLTALGVMKISRPQQEDHSVRFADTFQDWEKDRTQRKHYEDEASLENNKDCYFEFDEDVDKHSYLCSPQNPDTEEAFDLDPFL